MKGRDATEPDDFGFGESSRYAAHLDRGWALLGRGDPATARTSAEHAQQARPDDPDAALLLGAVALAEGDPEQSLRSYERAIELDAEYLEPYTAAAQVCIYDLDDPARALGFCEEALSLDALSPFDQLEVSLLAAECELLQGHAGAATGRLRILEYEAVLMNTLRLGCDPDVWGDDAADEPPPGEDPWIWEYLAIDPDGDPLDQDERNEKLQRVLALAIRLARMRLDLGETELVQQMLDKLLTGYPYEADLWYLASEAHHRQGELPEACVAAVKTLELDLGFDLPSWVPDFDVVHKQTVEFIAQCPEPTISTVAAVGRPMTVLVRDVPAPELVMEGIDPRAPVIALAARPAPLGGPPPAEPPLPQLTGLAVYRRNLARFCPNEDSFKQELRRTVLDELATFIRLDNPTRERLGLAPLPEPVAPAPEEKKEEEKKPKRTRRRSSRSTKKKPKASS